VIGAILTLFVGCGESSEPSTQEIENKQHEEVVKSTPAVEIVKNVSITKTPASFEQYALLANGKITVNNSFGTDGPLADIHSNEDIVSNSRSVNITGRVSAYKGTYGNFRAVNTDIQNGKLVQFRALKVKEYDVNGSLPDAYILKKDGTFVKRFNNQETLAEKSAIEADITYNNGIWTLKATNVRVDLPVKCETDLVIDVEKLFIAGSLLVEGDLNTKGELSINVGTPFEKGLIVDDNIIVDKLEIIGKVFGSGNFTGNGTINITGSAKIDGDVNLNGKTKLNYLDTVYQSAMSNAQDDFNNTDFMLVHSQLFENLKGRNSVVLFTFVKGNYLIDEDTLQELIETNATKDFEFKSYLYGATLDYASDLAKYDSLSPYYASKLNILKELETKGYKDVEITNSLDISPQEFYHTFSTKEGKVIGTYLVDSVYSKVSGLMELTQEKREEAYKEKYDEVTINEAKAEIENLKNEADLKIPNSDNVDLDALEARTDLNASQKEQIREFVLENSIDENVTVNEELEKKEAAQDRIKEWIYEKELEGDIMSVDVDVVGVDQATNTRGWWSKLKRKANRWWRRTKARSCYTVNTPAHFLSGVNESTSDLWLRDVAYGNPSGDDPKRLGSCVQTAAAMMIRYLAIHHNRKVLPIYENREEYKARRSDPLDVLTGLGEDGRKSSLVQLLNDKFNADSNGGVPVWHILHKVPREIEKTLNSGGIYASVWVTVNSGWWFSRSSWFRTIKSDIDRNRPVIMNALNHQWIKNHALDIIGYKATEYKGWACSWKPNKNYLYAGTGWSPDSSNLSEHYSPKKWFRYDGRTNYWTTPASFTRVRVNSVKVEWSWWRNWWNSWY